MHKLVNISAAWTATAQCRALVASSTMKMYDQPMCCNCYYQQHAQHLCHGPKLLSGLNLSFIASHFHKCELTVTKFGNCIAGNAFRPILMGPVMPCGDMRQSVKWFLTQLA